MEFLIKSDWVSLLFVGLGTLFLIGEILVKMRGFFALLGIIFISYYFYLFTIDTTNFMLMIFIYFIGLLLIIIDGKVLNDGTLGTIGLTGMIFSVALTAPNIFAGLYAVLGIILGASLSFVFLKFFKRRNMWQKIALKDRLTKDAGYSSLTEEYTSLLGKQGSTVTNLRPVGTVQIEGKNYSALSNAQWIVKGTKVEVIEVDGTKILVKPINDNR